VPFPLAHPAAVLPLRRYCPRYLSFPGLIAGSLSPDFGYLLGHLHVDQFSHRFWAGSFGFCLPAGLLAVGAYYLVRPPLLALLPARYAALFRSHHPEQAGFGSRDPIADSGNSREEAQKARPGGAGNPKPEIRNPKQIQIDGNRKNRNRGDGLRISASVLLGAWSHHLLDSLSHPDGWLVEHLRALQHPVPWFRWFGTAATPVCDLLYNGFTFSGAALLAAGYLCWLQSTTSPALPPPRTVARWSCALLFSGAILALSKASRGEYQSLGLIPLGLATAALVLAFAAATFRPFAGP
jgi:hypothetical protein